MLYPLKFNPILKEKVWGGQKLHSILNKNVKYDKTGESWELSSLPENISIVSDGKFKGVSLNELITKYKEQLLGKKIYDKYGKKFPLLIKFIDAADDLSIQVHPDNETAQKLYGENGKNELWYILDSDEDAELILGVKNNLNSEKFRKAVYENTIIEKLNTFNVKRGDVFYIPAGRIHAIKKGVLLAEIQQPSDITYRIYDWNRKGLNGKFRDLHIKEACEVAELSVSKTYYSDYPDKINEFVSCEKNSFFTVNILKCNKKIKKEYRDDRFKVFLCTKGNFKLQYSGGEREIHYGETVLLPAVLKNISFIPDGECEILEVFV